MGFSRYWMWYRDSQTARRMQLSWTRPHFLWCTHRTRRRWAPFSKTWCFSVTCLLQISYFVITSFTKGWSTKPLWFLNAFRFCQLLTLVRFKRICNSINIWSNGWNTCWVITKGRRAKKRKCSLRTSCMSWWIWFKPMSLTKRRFRVW